MLLVPRKRMTFLVVGLLLTGITACGGSAPTRFYILSPISGMDQGIQVTSTEPCTTIGIGPVEVPAYLDRQQIMTRVNANELHLAGFEEWAEPLKDNLTRVLVENLFHLLPADAFSIFPFRGPASVNWQVEVQVMRWDGALGGNVFLLARWSIYDKQTSEMLVQKTSRFSHSTGGPEYGDLAAAYSRVVEALSHELAGAIQSLCAKRNRS